MPVDTDVLKTKVLADQEAYGNYTTEFNAAAYTVARRQLQIDANSSGRLDIYINAYKENGISDNEALKIRQLMAMDASRYMAVHSSSYNTNFGISILNNAGLLVPNASIEDVFTSALANIEYLEKLQIEEQTVNLNTDPYSAFPGGSTVQAMQDGGDVFTVVLEPSNILAKTSGAVDDKIDAETQRLFYRDAYARNPGGNGFLNNVFEGAGMVFSVLGVNGVDDYFSTANSAFGTTYSYNIIRTPVEANNYGLNPKYAGVVNSEISPDNGFTVTELSEGESSYGAELTGSLTSKEIHDAREAKVGATVPESVAGIATITNAYGLTSTSLPSKVGKYGVQLNIATGIYDAITGDEVSAQQRVVKTLDALIKDVITQKISGAVLGVIGATTSLNALIARVSTVGAVVGATVTELMEVAYGIDTHFGPGGELVGYDKNGKQYNTEKIGWMEGAIGSIGDGIEDIVGSITDTINTISNALGMGNVVGTFEYDSVYDRAEAAAIAELTQANYDITVDDYLNEVQDFGVEDISYDTDYNTDLYEDMLGNTMQNYLDDLAEEGIEDPEHTIEVEFSYTITTHIGIEIVSHNLQDALDNITANKDGYGFAIAVADAYNTDHNSDVNGGGGEVNGTNSSANIDNVESREDTSLGDGGGVADHDTKD